MAKTESFDVTKLVRRKAGATRVYEKVPVGSVKVDLSGVRAEDLERVRKTLKSL